MTTALPNRPVPIRLRSIVSAAAILLAAPPAGAADETAEGPREVRHQVTGLFSEDRAEDLKRVFARLPEFELKAVDFENAEVRLEYDPRAAFPGATPEQAVERLDRLVRQASRSTFGVKPLRTVPRERLRLVEIPVAGLDCKGCCLAAYEAVYRLDGVEQATASFRDRRVTAWIDPGKTDRAALADALRKKGIPTDVP